MRLRGAVELDFGAVGVFGAGARVPELEAVDDALAAGQNDPLAVSSGRDEAVNG